MTTSFPQMSRDSFKDLVNKVTPIVMDRKDYHKVVQDFDTQYRFEQAKKELLSQNILLSSV